MPKQSFTRTLLKKLKSLSKSFNIHKLAGILGIGGEDVSQEEQIVELRVYKSEDEPANDDVLLPTEVAATKQKFADVVVEDEESQVAEKLRECCDGFGREKPEMLGQSAAFLLKLGELYRNYAKNGKGIQQKLNFIKSAALIVGAMVRYEQIKNEEGLEISKCEIRELQDEIQMVASLRKGFNVLEISQDLKRVLEECRVEVFEKFDDVFRTTKESEGKVRRERLEEAYDISTKHYLNIMRETAEKCQDIMGKPPCKFTIVGLGSLARKETTLYSDFQHAIILEDGITESPPFDEVMEYFQWYTTIFQIIIIGFGETSITNVDVKSLNDLYSKNQSKKWFSDEHTPYGICFDSMMPNACKIPLGRREPTKYRKHAIELIQPVSQMANLLTREEDIRNGCNLSEILSKTIFVSGNQEVYDCYLKALHHMRSQQTQQIFLERRLQWLFFPNITASHPGFLYAVQERLTSLLSCLANLFHVRSQSGFEIVHEFLDNGAIDHYMYYELMDAVAVALEIKTKIDHLILSHKARNFSRVHVINLVGEERVASCYKTVMQYTILLQHQLLDLLREDGILEMQLFPDETYGEENKVVITLLLGIKVIWKEVDFGLSQTCEAIDKYEKHAEISSAEAKFVMRMALVALSTVSEHAVLYEAYLFGLQILFPDKLESHCIFFLQFLKDDIQALIYYYQLMFLIHCQKGNLQQAYEDYYKCQELCFSQQNQSTCGNNQWMCLDFLQIKVIDEVKVTDDMLERIKQQIATEANYPRRLVLTVQYCVALLNMGQKEEANKNLLMLRKLVGKKAEWFNLLALMELILETDKFDAGTVSYLVLQILLDTTRELSNFLSKGNISGMKLEIFEQHSIQWKLASNIQLELTEARSLQYIYYITSLLETLSLAAGCFVSNRRKSSHLLWKILHSPSVTKPMMLDSVLVLFRHVWHGLSSQAVDGNIMDINTIPREHGTVNLPLLDKGSISIQASPPRAEAVSSTSLHQTAPTQPSNALPDHPRMAQLQLQEERQEGTSDDEAFSNMQGNEENIVASESKNVPISKEGGEIDVGGCAVTFHLGSFDDVSKVHAKSEIDSSKWPPKYICITAMLWVHSERNLLKRASVAMKSWCRKNRTDSRKVEVHLLHLKKGSITWDVVARFPLNDQKVFHFDCADFSPYVFGVHEDDLAATDHVIEGHVYAGRGNNFSLAFFLQHDLIKKSVINDMAMKHSEFQLNFSPMLVQPQDKIFARLKCMEETFRFPNEFEKTFKIDDKFVRLKKAFFHSFLIGTSNDPKYVPFECQVQQNDTLADGPHYFNYEWKPNQSAPQRRPELTTVTTEIRGPGPIRDVHVLGTGNIHDHRQNPSPGSTERDNDSAGQSQQAGPSS